MKEQQQCNKHQSRDGQKDHHHSDDPSVASSANSSTAAAWLDQRIAEQRKTYNGTRAMDREAKERSKASAAKPGAYREPSKTQHLSATPSPSSSAANLKNITDLPQGRRSASYRLGGQEESEASSPPKKPTRTNSRKVNNSVRSALEDLEKDVLRTMPNTSPKVVSSPKGLIGHTSSKQHSPGVASSNLQQMEEDIVAKRRAKTSGTPCKALTKRSTPLKSTASIGSSTATPLGINAKDLSQMEKDVAAKAQAKGTSKSTAVAKRLNQMERDMEAKAQARGSASSMVATAKRLNALGGKAASKAPANASPSMSTASKRLNQMEADVAAKAKARSGSSNATTKQLETMEADIAFKAQSRASRDSMTVATARSTQTGVANLDQIKSDVLAKQSRSSATYPGAVSISNVDNTIHGRDNNKKDVLNEGIRPGAYASTSADLEERIAYKTGIPLTSELRPEERNDSNKNRGFVSQDNNSKLINVRMEGQSMNKDIIVVPEGARDRNALQSLHQGPNAPVDYRLDIDGFLEDEEGDRLAVAVAVKDYEDENVFIPSAVEYDPDAKPPMYKNRRFRMYGLLGCILLILFVACAIGIMAIQQQNKNQVTQDIPTNAPTCERCSLGIEEQLELEVGSEKLYDPSTPEFKAKEWIVHEDPMQLRPEDPNLIQRFLLAAFYFDTHTLGDWLSCNKQGEDDPDETCSFQKIISIFPLEYEGVPENRWLSSNHECGWAGISCDELNQTRVIDLHGQEMQGTFPSVLTLLPYVQTITMAWNKFVGPLPASIGAMKHLLNLEIQYNEFTGNLPTTWSNSKNLQLMNFAGNFLSGQLPAEVGDLRNIKGMFLYENMLTGTLPDEFAQVSLLTYARFQRNLLSGTISTVFGDMKLNELWLHRNPITGTIPTELGKLSNHMFDLRLYDTQLEGTIPDEIWGLTDLWRFDLHWSNFTGTISTEIGNLQSLNVFRISDNNFSGTLPTELASLTSITTLWVGGNNFNGSMPSGICDAKSGEVFEFVEADCLADPETGTVALFCECCDSCCNAQTGECN